MKRCIRVRELMQSPGWAKTEGHSPDQRKGMEVAYLGMNRS